jgi:hypothetical protein
VDERRRSPRRAVQDQFAILPTTINVQVLDVSMAGVLLWVDQPLDVGTEGNLVVNLDGSRFTADVQVQRVVAAGAEGGFRLGARFTNLNPDGRQLIAQFMAQ